MTNLIYLQKKLQNIEIAEILKMSLRQPWTEKEDQILSSLVKKYGTTNWILISQKMQTRANTNSRSGKQCRERWHNHLDPQVSKNSWTLQEEQMMFKAHQKYGNRWAQIAGQLKNRTDNDVKNHFYAIIRKSLRRISKMFGHKNSTSKINNLKPSLLSRLLDNTRQKNAKQTSQALFKFIFSRQNLNVDSIQKKSKKLLEELVDQITTSQNSQKTDLSKQQMCLEDKPQLLQKQQSLKSKKKLKNNSKREFFFNKTIKSEIKKKKDNSNLIEKKSQIDQEILEKQIQEKDEVKFQTIPLEMFFDKKCQKKPSIFQNFSPSAGFQWIEQNQKKESLNERRPSIKQVLGEEKDVFGQFMIMRTPCMATRRSSIGNQMCRILSNNDKRTIYVTPKNPTPGTQSLFPSWNINHKLTNEQIDDQRDRIRKQILKNNKEI